jgi:peptidoglycan/LPS O-acetylase OafA/YrhL
MRRVLPLDGLRGIAILMVFAYHAWGIPLLWSGVDLFFVMSGYLITGILLRLKGNERPACPGARSGYWQEFYFRRARRILPPYLLFLLVVGFFFRIPWPQVWYWYAFFAANLAIALGRFFEMALVPLWSLAVEEQFYLVWPFVVRFAGITTLKRIALSLVVLIPVLRALCTPLFQSHWAIYTLACFRLDAIAWGALISISEFNTPSWTSSHRALALTSAITAGTILGALSAFSFFRYTANSIPFNALGYTLIGITFAGALTYVLGSRQGSVHRVLSMPALRYLGKISYTFYLYHFGVLLVFLRIFHSRALSGVAAFLVTTGIAALSWAILESPILTRPTAKVMRAVAG